MRTKSLTIVGTGVMATGMALAILRSGRSVVCVGHREASAEAARRWVTERLGADGEAAARLRCTTELGAGLAGADLVIEAVPEDLALKVRIFRELDRLAAPSTVLSSTTSGFPVAALAGATDRPELVLGWHWAWPAQTSLLAEIVVTAATAPQVTAGVVALARELGKHPVVVRDNERAWGFVANRIFMAARREAEAIVAEGTVAADDVDRLVVDGYGWPSGPFGGPLVPDGHI